MSTTAVFVEILIVGIQASIWCVLLTLAICGVDWVPAAKEFVKGWEPMISVFYLAIAYTLGTFVDRAADCVFLLYKPRIILMKFKWVRRHAEVAHADPRVEVLRSENKATEFLEFIRSRIRIARATTVNLALIGISAVFFIGAQTQYKDISLLFIVACVAISATALSMVAHAVLEVTYTRRLGQAHFQIVQEDKGSYATNIR